MIARLALLMRATGVVLSRAANLILDNRAYDEIIQILTVISFAEQFAGQDIHTRLTSEFDNDSFVLAEGLHNRAQ